MSDVTRILTTLSKATDELLPLVARSGGHPACRRAVASSPAERGAVAIQASRKIQRAGQLGQFYRVAGRPGSSAPEKVRGKSGGSPLLCGEEPCGIEA